MRHLGTFALILGLLALAACGGGSGSGDVPDLSGDLPGNPPPASGKGLLRISVTDAPFPYDYVESAVIEIQEIRVRDGGDADEDSGWITVFDTPTVVDLVPLTGGISQAIVDAELDPGSYDQIRILVEPVEVVLSDEAVSAIGTHTYTYAEGNVKFPSGSTSGLKVKFEEPLEVVSELTSDLTLDFDMSKNFVFNGPIDHNPGVKRVLFTPVVRATNTSEGGSILVTVWSDAGTRGDTSDDAPLPGAGVSVRNAADEEVASGPTATDGTYTASGIAVGEDYTVVITATGHAEPDAPPIPVLPVVAANLTDFGTILMKGTLEISGVVFTDNATTTDSTDDDVLQGVSVQRYEVGTTTAVGTAVTTDANGAYVFTFTDTETGPYDLVFTPPTGFAGTTLTNIPGEIQETGTSRDATMLAGQAIVSGTVTDGATPPVALQNVSITAVSTLGFDATAAGAILTDVNGQYSITLPTGTFTLTFDDGLNPPKTASVTVVGAQPTTPPTPLPTITQDMTIP